jgi:hypothetical protein
MENEKKILKRKNFCDEKNFLIHRRCVCSVAACRCSSPLCLQRGGVSLFIAVVSAVWRRVAVHCRCVCSVAACRCSSPLCLHCVGALLFIAVVSAAWRRVAVQRRCVCRVAAYPLRVHRRVAVHRRCVCSVVVVVSCVIHKHEKIKITYYFISFPFKFQMIQK